MSSPGKNSLLFIPVLKVSPFSDGFCELDLRKSQCLCSAFVKVSDDAMQLHYRDASMGTWNASGAITFFCLL